MSQFRLLSVVCLIAAAVGLLPRSLSATQVGAEVSGAAVYVYCVGCHGHHGEGGDGGRNPRLAGLSVAYLDRQLHAFKTGQRVNKPMLPIFSHPQFTADIIATVAEYIAAMPVPDLALWPYRPDPVALAEFQSRGALRAAGEARYDSICAACHAANGAGDEDQGAPSLTAQYPAYLRKQILDFANGARTHDASGRCGDLAPPMIEAVLAHLVELGRP
ncbi:MAG: hypothetical protein EA400_11360 [Chromatiaceae bacterium]|nr:MAG: hypothetical protein EA400_11360 [Chromatiaceae bacterium]